MSIDAPAPPHPVNFTLFRRFLPNLFPWHGHICNYGAFPQTWENPFHRDEWTGLAGDRDPLDVCEIGSRPVPTGTVMAVKVYIGYPKTNSDKMQFSHCRCWASWP